MFLLYAVIWALYASLLTGSPAYSFAAEAPASVQETIRTLDDPFDVPRRAPGIIELFVKGLEELKKQFEPKTTPVKEKQPLVDVQPVTVAHLQEPVKATKLDIPSMLVTGIVYESDRPQAIINGRVVGVGDVLDGVTILKIQKGRIDARYEDEDIILKMNNGRNE